MTPATEYQPNPQLALLSQELEILNRALLAEGFDDHVRLVCLRHAAQQMLRFASLFRPVEFDEDAEREIA